MIRSVGPRDAQDLLAQAKEPIDIVDVREPSEWARGHLPGARLVPIDTLRRDFDAAGVGPRVLFVCAVGGRSLAAAKLTDARGGREVMALEGGTSAWADAGLPIEIPEPTADAAGASTEAPTDAAEVELGTVIGANVKELRTQRGLTLDLLAGLSGVGRQTLGQIEIGLSAPSVGTLWKIAHAFDVPFSTLLARPHSRATTVLRADRATRLVSADGRFSSRALFPAGERGRVEIYELWLAGHAREDAEAHSPGTRENLAVTSGRLTLDVGDATFELGKGDAIEFVADVPHSYVNPGKEECWMHLVMTYAPPPSVRG